MGIILGIACLVGLGLVWLPVPTRTEIYSAGRPGWSFQLTRPWFMRAGDAADMALQVILPPGSDNQVITTRFDVADLLGTGGELGEVAQSGGRAHFNWSLQPDQAGSFQGRLWIYAGPNRELLNAREIAFLVIGPAPAVLWSARILLLFGGFTSAFLILFRDRQRS